MGPGRPSVCTRGLPAPRDRGPWALGQLSGRNVASGSVRRRDPTEESPGGSVFEQKHVLFVGGQPGGQRCPYRRYIFAPIQVALEWCPGTGERWPLRRRRPACQGGQRLPATEASAIPEGMALGEANGGRSGAPDHAARKVAIERTDGDYRRLRASPFDRAGRATEMLQRTQDPAFVPVRVGYLQRTMGRGRP